MISRKITPVANTGDITGIAFFVQYYCTPSLTAKLLSRQKVIQRKIPHGETSPPSQNTTRAPLAQSYPLNLCLQKDYSINSSRKQAHLSMFFHLFFQDPAPRGYGTGPGKYLWLIGQIPSEGIQTSQILIDTGHIRNTDIIIDICIRRNLLIVRQRI